VRALLGGLDRRHGLRPDQTVDWAVIQTERAQRHLDAGVLRV
jgi:hypothetical protein